MSQKNLSEVIRSAVAQLGQATAAQLRAAIDPVWHDRLAKRLSHLCRDGHLTRSGEPREYVYRVGRPAAPYGGTAAERAARRARRREVENERARAKYAAKRGGNVRLRPVPDPRVISRPKPTSAQQIAITPARHETRVIPAKQRQPMTSQEWEAQGGVVERLGNGVVSKANALRFDYSA